MQPTVSIACTTFNHASFIRQCLEGFLMQQTTYTFEIVIYDDASTDGTQDIIQAFQQQYPDIIFPLLQTENQYSKGVRGMMAKFNFPRCRGKYIALCEGDDYWINPLKLQQQIDYLEQHPDIVFSMGKVNFLYNDTGKILPKKELIDPSKQAVYTIKDYLKQPFSQTSTFLFRNLKQEMPTWTSEVMAGDQSLVVILVGKFGKIKMHDEVFSNYRVNGASTSQANLLPMLKSNFKMFKYWNEYLDFEFNALIRSRIIENRLIYFLFKPKFMNKLYKNYAVEAVLQFFYKGIMAFKNKFA